MTCTETSTGASAGSGGWYVSIRERTKWRRSASNTEDSDGICSSVYAGSSPLSHDSVRRAMCCDTTWQALARLAFGASVSGSNRMRPYEELAVTYSTKAR